MIFSLEVRRARKGDCLLLHYGSKEEPGLVVIDGGPRGVYTAHLRPRLEQIRRARGVGDKPLQIDLLMVSHVDDDHIQGILELTKELLAAKGASKPQLVRVLSFWHNSFDDVIDRKPVELTASIKTQFGAAALSGSGELSEDEQSEIETHYAGSDRDVRPGEEAELVTGTLKVLASVDQGHRLRSEAKALGFPLNPEFDEEPIVAAKGGDAVELRRGLKFVIAGPMQPDLEDLRKKHNAWVKKLRNEGKTPSQALAAYVDRSVPNLSSLVMLAKFGGKKILLTGDARGDRVLKGLERVGLMKKKGKIKIDILKVPHHGSSNNIDDDFFERIIAKHYVFSGDGEHGNPEREALEMLVRARGKNDYTIHLTYPIDCIDKSRKEDWEKEQRKEWNRKKKNPKQKVRANWNAAKNSLRAFFDRNPGLEAKVKVVDPKRSHAIDLLDPIGF